MKKNRLIIVLFLLIGLWSNAQTPTFVGQTSASAIGSGPGGKPTLSWNIPPGKDRVMIITLAIERYHDPSGGNFPSTPATAGNGIYVNGNFATYLNGRIYRDPETYSDSRYSFSHSLFYLSDANGDLPTGDVDFTMPDLNTPVSAGDEIIITATLYEGVKNVVDFAYDGVQSPTGTTVASASNPHPTVVGNGVTAANILYVGFGASSQSSQLTFAPSTWSSPTSIILNNNAGPAPSGSVGEPNGISVQVGHRTFAANSTPTLTVTKESNSNSMRGVANMIALMPFAHPSVSGTVYNDTNGPSSIGGTGTNAGGLYVNAIDDDNKLIFSATVAANGTFTIPTGYVIEGNNYRFELSKNTGTIGNNAPIKELPTNWTTVGESTTPSGNDGIHDGTIELTIEATNITGLRYGIKTCLAGNTAPPVQNLSNICPLTTVNLNNAHTGTIPTGATVSLLWFDNNLHTGTPLSGTGITEAGAGTYFAFYYDSAADCYSLASNTVTVTITNCATCTNSGVTSVNLNQLYTGTFPAGVVLEWWTSPTRDLPPTPGTKVLDPTNVTVSGTYYAFFYDTVNNCYNTDNSTAAVVVNILPPCATCTNPGSTAIGGNPTKVGITVQQKQETWPESIKNGFIALQSQNKGMVITRVATVGGGTGGAPNLTTDSIKDPKEGMLVYDLTADCVKLYNGTIWKCLAKDCL